MTTLYLSQLCVNSRSREAWRDLADCQGLHRTLMRAFPDGLASGVARAEVGLLFRPEADPRTGLVRVLVQSLALPNWHALPAGYVAPVPGSPMGWATRTIPEAIWNVAAGTVRRFRLRANVTCKVNGARVPLRTEAAQVDWLCRHADAGGFRIAVPTMVPTANPDHPEGWRAQRVGARVTHADLPAVVLRPDVRLQGRRVDQGLQSRRLTFDGVVFDGVLAVVDGQRFAHAVRGGIGPAKGYGYGLLSVAPA